MPVIAVVADAFGSLPVVREAHGDEPVIGEDGGDPHDHRTGSSAFAEILSVDRKTVLAHHRW